MRASTLGPHLGHFFVVLHLCAHAMCCDINAYRLPAILITLSPCACVRDQSVRHSSDVLVAVARSAISSSSPLTPEVEGVAVSGGSSGSEGGRGGGGRGVITVYTSLLVPVEVEDELAWLKLPMAVAGVLVFVLFKMFGPGRKTPSPTPQGAPTPSSASTAAASVAVARTARA